MNLKFLHPEILFALSFIAIPIIVHLFNFRKFKKVYFTNVRFLREISIQTQSRSKLKHLLVLASRILAIIFIVLAFAQPFIPISESPSSPSKIINIYIDNSFSMSAMGKNGQLLEEAKRKAKEIILAHPQSDKFKILTNDFEAKHRQSLSRQKAIEEINETKMSPGTKIFSEVMAHQKTIEKTNTYVLSDFQKSAYSFSKLKNDSNTSYVLIHLLAGQKSNLFIDSCWLSSPVNQLNVPNELVVKLGNSSSKDIENVPVKLSINEKTKAITSTTILSGTSTLVKLPFTLNEPGIQEAQLTITDNPVTFDDNFFFSLDIAQKVNVLEINDGAENKYIDALYNYDTYFNYKKTDASKVDYSLLPINNLIILDGIKNISSGLVQELKRYISNNGSIIIIPNADINKETYEYLAQELNIKSYFAINNTENKVKSIEMGSDLFKGVFDKEKLRRENLDFPKVKKFYELQKDKHVKEEVLLKMETGHSFLSKFPKQKGSIFLFTSPFDKDYSNFVEHALFVPVLFKIALNSIKSDISYYTIGSDEIIETGITNEINENSVHLVNKKNNFDIIPEVRKVNEKSYFNLHNTVKVSGFYELTVNSNLKNSFAFNYNRLESSLESYSPEELEAEIKKFNLENIRLIESDNKELKNEILEINSGIRLWKLALFLGLLFLIIEILLLKFLK